MKRLPNLLPQHLLSEKHVFEGLDTAIELVDRTSAKTGLHSPIIVDTSDLEPNTLRAGLSAIASRLLLTTRLAGRYVVLDFGGILWLSAVLLVAIRLAATVTVRSWRHGE
jgi:hypothetical protein